MRSCSSDDTLHDVEGAYREIFLPERVPVGLTDSLRTEPYLCATIACDDRCAPLRRPALCHIWGRYGLADRCAPRYHSLALPCVVVSTVRCLSCCALIRSLSVLRAFVFGEDPAVAVR